MVTRSSRIALVLALWSFGYAGYRAYYALGGEIGMIGTPESDAQFRALNGVGALLIAAAGVLALVAVRVPTVARALPVLGWIGAVGCTMHALVDMTLRVLSLTGVHPTQLPDLWLTYDRQRSDLQDLFLNEPWFLVTGLLWGALALTQVTDHHRLWLRSAVSACLALVVIGVLSGLDVIGSFIVG
jgi:hypothetical protein